MIYAITDNPYKEGVVGYSNGVMTSSKAAKLNNEVKRPVLVKNWENLRPVENKNIEIKQETPINHDYKEFLDKTGITVVEHINNGNTEGAKKIRVNKIVNEKASEVYNNTERMVIETVKTPKEEVTVAPIEVKEEVTNNISSFNDFVGKHGRTGEVPVNEIKEAVRNDEIPQMSRVSRNLGNEINTQSRVEPGDVDLYNSLLHNEKDDVSRQLQGAREELSMEKEENKKLIQEYEDAVKELQQLKTDLANRKRMQEEKAREELNTTLNDLASLKEENLARTSDISSVKAEIAKLLAQERELNNEYGSGRGMGRAA